MIRERLSAALFALAAAAGTAHASWRSELYPEDWTPGYRDSDGGFLHDFSYAGYHGGADPVPDQPPGPVVDVTQPPYQADPSGQTDSTAAIQQALRDVGEAGGGIVYLPAGTYRVRPPPGSTQALYIGWSRVVLRGAGRDQTYLFNEEPDMRLRRIISVRPDPDSRFSWYWGGEDVRSITEDLTEPTRSIPIESVEGYGPGDWIVLRSDPTAEFIADHGMTGTWSSEEIGGPIFYRRIEAVDQAMNTLTIDTPLRYPLLQRDHARINRIAPHLSEIGVEHFSIGNLENTTPGTGDDDYDQPGTGAYQMHASFAIYFTHVVNGWIRDVATYRPTPNQQNVHILSDGVRLDASRFVTVSDCDIRRPEYQGAGGNGDLIVISSQESLVTHCHAEHGRHNYTFALMYSSGNVIHRSSSKTARLPSDFHMHLSMANLVDNLALEDDHLEAVRRECCGHGHSTTQSVFWNIEGTSYPHDQFFIHFIIDSAQFGRGYIIGTRGPASQIRVGSDADTSPVDHAEGIGQGDSLEPASLYEDQLRRRLGPAAPEADAGPERPSGRDAGPASPDAGVGGPGRAGSSGGCTAAGPAAPLASAYLLLAILLIGCRRVRWRRRGAPQRVRRSSETAPPAALERSR